MSARVPSEITILLLSNYRSYSRIQEGHLRTKSSGIPLEDCGKIQTIRTGFSRNPKLSLTIYGVENKLSQQSAHLFLCVMGMEVTCVFSVTLGKIAERSSEHLVPMPQKSCA